MTRREDPHHDQSHTAAAPAVEALVRRLPDSAVTVLLISHGMAQVMRVADVAYVLRGGTAAARRSVADTSGDELVGLITGAIDGDGDA